MICPDCGAERPDASPSCPSCGALARPEGARPSVGAGRPGEGSGTPLPSDASAEVASGSPTVDGRSAGRIESGSVLAGRYRILELVGRGGMGEVYRARDLRLDQTVALKFIAGEVCNDPRALARMVDEVRIARQVTHPNFCRVFDIAESGGRQFLSMEFIEGEDLASRFRTTPRLPYEQALAIAHQLCAGLAAAHERQVVHRDLKPSNIMIDKHGIARITDFGIAEATRAVRGARAMEGTPLYMSPEQLAGREATAQSDIYALGLLLYELFTGVRPHEGASPVALYQARQVPARAPSVIARDLDRKIDRIILRCLNADPAQRPATAKAVAAALPGGEPPLAAQQAAQQRADRIAAFRQELCELRAAGVLDLDESALGQVERFQTGVLRDLIADYDVDTSERGRQLSLGMRIVSLVGAVAFAASAFYFFYRIWGVLSLSAQAGILIGATVLALLATAAIAAWEKQRYFTTMAAAFAFTCMVLNATVLSLTLNQVPSPEGWLCFGLFAIILGHAYRVYLAYACGIVLLGFYLAALTVELCGGDWMEPLARPESMILPGILAMAVPLIFARRRDQFFGVLDRSIGLVLAIGAMLILSVAGELSALPLPNKTVEATYELFGLVGTAVAMCVGIRNRKKDLVYVGGALLGVLMFLAFVRWCWDWMPRYLFFLIVAIGSVGAVLALKRIRGAMVGMPGGGAP